VSWSPPRLNDRVHTTNRWRCDRKLVIGQQAPRAVLMSETVRWLAHLLLRRFTGGLARSGHRPACGRGSDRPYSRQRPDQNLTQSTRRVP
jgi:hypothetical protein